VRIKNSNLRQTTKIRSAAESVFTNKQDHAHTAHATHDK